MEEYNIFEDIAKRTGGDIYIGVVGPVRTGKSTFIKRFMDLTVLPRIQDVYDRERAKDELPQSGGGRTIMTTEPKFIPNEAVAIDIDDNINVKVRLVDCVGYTVEGALGYVEDDGPRMVVTPWFEEEIPFQEAAEIGTRKVISDHSTIGIVIITDGSITELPRSNYLDAEERVIRELQEINKPYLVLLNSVNPNAKDTQNLASVLAEKYDVPVLPVDCAEMSQDDINVILREVLYEFPVQEVNINLPKWIEKLDRNHWCRKQFEDSIKEAIGKVKRIRDVEKAVKELGEKDFVSDVALTTLNLGQGISNIEMFADKSLFFTILEEVSGFTIDGEHRLLELMRDLSVAKKEYDKFATALKTVNDTGYGIVPPSIDDMTFEEPELYKRGGHFGVKLKANAPSIHLIKTDVNTEVTPFMGSARQSEELIQYLTEKFEANPEKLWGTEFLGRSLYDLVRDGLQNKLYHMPENTQHKIQRTLQKIVNDGSSNLICIIF